MVGDLSQTALSADSHRFAIGHHRGLDRIERRILVDTRRSAFSRASQQAASMCPEGFFGRLNEQAGMPRLAVMTALGLTVYLWV